MARLPKAKHCPFCRGEDTFVECIDFGDFSVICNGCGARGPNADGDGCDPDGENARGKRNAIKAWNKRQKSNLTAKGGENAEG